ncbi:glutaredoxin family protein [Halorubrum sp. JWXQ-INN 858]|nr:glutaredoxin family protein [Halorubrum sp. JWXQ-INN 858]
MSDPSPDDLETPGGSPDDLETADTEPGRDDAVPVTIYTREGCSLCTVAHGTVERVAADLSVAVAVDLVDVDEDPELADEYGERVPYVFVDGHPAFKYEIDERELRLKLLSAA